jgi:RecB family endonuclease NucS
LAIDNVDRFVVSELKPARGRTKALGQLLYYMAWVDNHLGNGPSRGIIVAKEISDDLVLAAQRLQGISLYRYTLSVSVERVL